jgi:hypothetical protein
MKIAYVLYADFRRPRPRGPYELTSRWPGAEVPFMARSLVPCAAIAA